MRRAVIVLWLAGCVSSDVVVCADGRLCPTGTRCHQVTLAPAELVCATPEQLRDCVDHLDFERCGAAGGRCYSGVCLEAGCGNGRVDPADAVEPAEMCDDTNTVPGDGCSADCRSDETCRNGVLDPITGEQCDDRNSLTHDGCSSTCEREPAAWSPVIEPTLAVLGYALAYEARRERVIMFGGERPDVLEPTPSDRTYEWDGLRWRTLATELAPSARTYATMVYDPARDRTTLFGGQGDGVLDDTWEWDGARWTPASPLVSPPARIGHAMAHDPIRARSVVFGGEGGGVLDDTWEWDGAIWIPSTGPAPSPRTRHAMAFDAARGVIVLFGGSAPDGALLDDTWELDAAGWRPIAVTGPVPAARMAHAMATDPVTGHAVLSGGVIEVGGESTSELWRFDGTRWLQLAATGPALAGHGLVPFVPRRALVALDGYRDAFVWNGTEWAGGGALDLTSPPTRHSHTAALDPVLSRIVIFGGGSTGVAGDTWTWSGGWQQIGDDTSFAPSPRTGTALVYDAERDELVLFGGRDATGPRADTWVLRGNSWTLLPVASPPPARAGHAMVYDVARRRVVLFGGGSELAPLDDTWLWDGAAWTRTALGAGPPARTGAAAAYDAVRRELVLFGGRIPGGTRRDTWRWDGAAWSELHPLHVPPGRRDAGFAFDPARGRAVLFGGLTGSATTSDVWEWDGQDWAQVPIAIAIQSRRGHSFVPSPLADGLLAFGGERVAGVARFPVDEHVLLGRGITGQADRCVRLDTDGDGLAGCADADCWSRCSPLCPPGVPAASPECASPRCGDGRCDKRETCSLCEVDCGACAASCGDFACSAGETAASCPGDCALSP